MSLQTIPDARAGRRMGVIRFSRAEVAQRSKARRRANGKDRAYSQLEHVKVAHREGMARQDKGVKAKTYRRWYAKKDPVSRLLHNAERRSKKRGLQFDLDPSDFTVLPTHCPVLGMELIYGASIGQNPREAGKAAFASLDRKDNTKGYVRGNVEIISWRANQLKSNATLDEIEAVARYMGGGNVNRR